MRLLVFGATGATGGPFTRLALEAGHEVTAVVRRPEALTLSHPHLEVVRGDVLTPSTWSASGQDAVVSCLGVRTTKPTAFYSESITHILAAGVPRLLVISALGLDIGPDISWVQKTLTRYVLQRILRYPYADLRRMEALVKASPLDWTIVRPPMLTNAAPKGTYRVAVNEYLSHPFKIARADLAGYMAENLSNRDIYKRTVEIGY